MSEIAKGFYSKKKHERAPNFVVAVFSVKAEEAIKTIQENVNDKGYVNFQILEKKDKTWLYVVIDDYGKEKKQEENKDVGPEDIPF